MAKRILTVLIAFELIMMVLVLAIAGILALNTPNTPIGSGGSETTFGLSGSAPFDDAVTIPREAEQGVMDIFNSMVDGVKKIVTAIFNLIMAPINAIITLIENWTGQLSSWYAPIIFVLVIMFVITLFRFYGMLDAILDKINI